MNALTLGIAVAAAMVWLSLQVRIGLVAARMYQIEEYESRRFLRWAMQRTWIDHRAALVAVLTVIAGYAIGFPL